MTDRLIPPWEDETKAPPGEPTALQTKIAQAVEHAFLAPSSAKKWLVCGPSAQLESTMPDDAEGMEGEWGPEGTLAHLCAERAARNWFWRETFERDDRFDKEMFAAADGWRKLLDSIMQNRDEWTFRFEDRINIEAFTVDGQFGRCDFWAYHKPTKTLYVFDFKYGRGVRVLAEQNEQMMIYGGGLLTTFKDVWEIDNVVLGIYQPRISPVASRWEIKAKHLLTWLKDVVKPAAKKATSADPGEFVPGKHCTDAFCKARFICRARADYATAIFRKHGTLNPKDEKLTMQEVGAALPALTLAKKYVSDIERYAKVQTIDRKRELPGFKVVAGPGKRVFKDIDAVIELMSDCGYTIDEYLGRSINLENLEKLVGPDHEVWDLCEKEEGGPVLVPDSDPRPAFQRTDTSAFDDEDELFEEGNRPEDF